MHTDRIWDDAKREAASGEAFPQYLKPTDIKALHGGVDDLIAHIGYLTASKEVVKGKKPNDYLLLESRLKYLREHAVCDVLSRWCLQ